MTGKVTDEMLMAFVDGETDAATASMIEQALAADAGLAARAEKFRASRALLRDAFGDARHEPVPDALIAAARGSGPKGTVLPFRRRVTQQYALPLAACLALAFAAAGYFAGQAGTGTGDPLGHAAMAAALAGTKSGESRTVTVSGQQALLETLATYRIDGGLCRSFDLTGAQVALSGVGCDRGGGWTVDMTVARGGGDGLYAPASDAALHSIDAYLDALEVSDPLGVEEEDAL